jgi:hypothetical protein
MNLTSIGLRALAGEFLTIYHVSVAWQAAGAQPRRCDDVRPLASLLVNRSSRSLRSASSCRTRVSGPIANSRAT